MFLVPFIGLSIIVHIAIILFFNVFHITPSNWHKIRRRKNINAIKAINTVFGSMIIISIFSFALLSAGLLVHTSITEKHSTVMFIEHNYVPIENYSYVPLKNFAYILYSNTIKIEPAVAE